MNTATASSKPAPSRLPAALLLAAGSSTRMGPGRHKLLATLGDTSCTPDDAPRCHTITTPHAQSPTSDRQPSPPQRPSLISHVAHTALTAHIASLTIVTGHAAGAIRQSLADLSARAAARHLPLNYCHNPDYASGIASSLRCGLAALPDESPAVLILLADMPRLTSAHLNHLIDQHLQQPQAIIVPSYAGQRGNPLIWPRHYFAAMSALQGDQGARQLLSREPQAIHLVAMPDNAIHEDADTPADAARLGLVF